MGEGCSRARWFLVWGEDRGQSRVPGLRGGLVGLPTHLVGRHLCARCVHSPLLFQTL